jgi:sporulation protein YlmC with PRC-barrel domain
MKTLMTTTALVASVAAGSAALAQSADNPFAFEGASQSDLHASTLIGMRVYAAEPATDGSDWTMAETDGLQTDWQDVGEINDMIVTRDGTIASVLVDIGGFLGIGERQVAMDMDDIRFVSDSGTDEADDFFLVIPAAVADLEEAPAYEMGMAHDGMTMPADDTAMTADDTTAPMAAADEAEYAYDETALTMDEVAVLTSEDLTGARVYDAEGEWIGEVSQLILTDDGQINAAIVDVGGFLGLGEKPVELSMNDLTINRMVDGDAFRVSVPMTEAELEAMPTWQDA